MKGVFRSLTGHNFRAWFFTALVSNVGVWMQSTAQSWVVLTELTDNDAIATGVTMAFQLTPQILLVPVTGYIADRFDRRILLGITQTLLGLLSVAVGVVLLTGHAQLWHIYLFALAFGVVGAVDQPVRTTFVSNLVDDRNVSNAVALNLASMNAARLIGPAAAGVVIALVGSGWVFLLNAVTFIPLLIALLTMRRGELRATPPVPRRRGQTLAGFVYVWRRSDLRVVLVMVSLLGLFSMNFPLFASTMAVEFGAGPEQFGLLTSIMAIGSLIGALLAAARERARIRLIIVAAASMGSFALIAALMPNFWAFAFTTVFIGLAGVSTFTTANGYVQTATIPELRGRVMSIHMAVVAAGTPIGAPLIGWVANEFGPRWALGSGFVLCAIACLIGTIWHFRHRRGRRSGPGAPTDPDTRTTPIRTDPED
ncbi:MFS transporter [Microbacterium tumbae]